MTSTHYFTSKMYADRVVAVPGVGRIYGHAVGSCSHTMGFDMCFMAEGADEATRGTVRFSARVAEDGSLQWLFRGMTQNMTRDWRLPPITEHDQPYYSAEAMAAMRRMVETMGERDAFGWYAQTQSAVDMELDGLQREFDLLIRSDADLTILLGDPSQPREQYVSKKEDPERKDFMRPATEEERATRRATWTENLARARNRLETLRTEKGARLALLQRLSVSMRGFSKNKGGPTPMELYALAIPEPTALAA